MSVDQMHSALCLTGYNTTGQFSKSDLNLIRTGGDLP